MIERYTLPEMGRIWSQEHKYEVWCRVETLVLEAHASAGTVPAAAVAPVRAAPPPTPEAVAAAEAVTDHDVIAFLTAWADNTVPRSAAAFVHFGMTSSDLLDTALAVTLTEATDLLITRATALVTALREHGLAHRDTLRAGRTHGIHAEPDVWGHRVADFAFAVARCRDRLRRARDGVAVGKLSGPVGTYSNIDPAIEAWVLPQLGLRPAEVGKGRSILVYGASGSIGTAAVQLSRHFGADVTAVCGTKNLELLTNLGADQVIDYTREDFTKNGQTYDVVFDAVGKHSFRRSRGSLNPGGIYLATDDLRNLLLAQWTRFGDKKVIFPIPPRYTKRDVLFLKGLMEAGQYRAVIDKRYPLAEVVEANRYVDTGQKTGNVVLTVG